MQLKQVRQQSKSRILLYLISNYQNTPQHLILFEHSKLQSIQKIENQYLKSQTNQQYRFPRNNEGQDFNSSQSSSISSIHSKYNLNTQNHYKIDQNRQKYYFHNQKEAQSPKFLIKKALSLSFTGDKQLNKNKEKKKRREIENQKRINKPISQLNFLELLQHAQKQQVLLNSPISLMKQLPEQTKKKQGISGNFRSMKLKTMHHLSPEDVAGMRIRTSQNQKIKNENKIYKKKLSFNVLKILKNVKGSQTSRN